jgi:hypothetical protein
MVYTLEDEDTRHQRLLPSAVSVPSPPSILNCPSMQSLQAHAAASEAA